MAPLPKQKALSESLRRDVWRVAARHYSRKDWAHGRSHVERVVKMALEIGREEGADLEIVELGAILHDIFAAKEPRSRDKSFRHDTEGAAEAERILARLGVDEKKRQEVAHCIASHRKRSGAEPRTIEAKCLFDGDKLDALGAIGTIRSAFIAFDHGQSVYTEVEDIEAYKRSNIAADGRVIDFSRHSSNLEYQLSLKDIPDRMYTETGKKLARERARFMGAFFERLGDELRGTV